jgi:hypothetical protein
MCGKPAKPTSLGSFLCPDCAGRYREFHCTECGQRVIYLAELTPDHPDLAADVCSLCHMRARAAALSAADRKAIHAAAKRGTLAGIRETRERLGWSHNEAVTLLLVLRGSAEPSAAADGGA